MAPAAVASAMGAPFTHSIQALKCNAAFSHFRCSISEVRRIRPSLSSSSMTTIWARPWSFESTWLSWRRVIKASVVEEEATTAEEEVEETEEIPIGDIVEKLVKADGVPGDTKLYVGNLPYNVDSAELARIVQEYAVPELVEVIYNRDTGRSKGFAFVTMSNAEECNLVIENLDGAQCQGRPLRVNMAAKPRPMLPLYQETEHKLFIGNLSWNVTSETLMSAFQEFGDVVDARVLYDGETGKSRGYGFVCYSKREEMETALRQLNGEELEGRSMRVGLAEGRKARYDQ